VRKSTGPKSVGDKSADRRNIKAAPLPSKEQVLAFIQESEGPVGKREIARAFQVKGGARIALKALLKDLAAEGAVARGRGRRLGAPGQLPEVMVLQVIGADGDGDLWARPVDFPEDDAEPRIVIIDEKRLDRPLTSGDRILASLARKDADLYEARAIRRLEHRSQRIIGLFEYGRDGAGRIVPTDKKLKNEFMVAPRDVNGAKPGEIVVAEAEPARRHGQPRARIIERIGLLGEARSVSMISIAEYRIPIHFPPAALMLAEAAHAAPQENRRDLRHIPLVTIDGEDARDFDDAVWAAPDEDPANPDGWRILVAIADVSYYVRSGDALDRAARERGNSVYFPDRVVPMLPEALSNGWCSLKPCEDRPVLAVEITLDAEGQKRRHHFMRGLMRSAARLTYTQAQAAIDGNPDATTAPLHDPVLMPLYGAFRALLKAREARGTLELDLPERRIHINAAGEVERIEARERLDSHRLIEEFMIAANVAAAEALEKKRQPCMYRVHDQPEASRVEALRDFLEGLDLHLARGQAIRPKHFTRLLAQAAATPHAEMIATLVLRAQAQAVYSPENIGHFGLALPRYAHFTSPIRRYADLLVHRALIAGYGLGDDGLSATDMADFADTAAHISATERRAAAAERSATDRYIAAFLSEQVGAVFDGRISGLAHFGLFIRLTESGADGLAPVGLLPPDFYDHDEARHALTGRRWGKTYRLGDRVSVRLRAAAPLTGGLTLEILDTVAPAQDGGDSRRPAIRHARKPGPGGKRKGRASRGEHAPAGYTAESAFAAKHGHKKRRRIDKAKTGDGAKAGDKTGRKSRKSPGP